MEDLEAEEVEAVASKFNTEINYIKDERIKESAIILISKIPDYFYTESASSTGKYHPKFSNGIGGLYRHTKAAVRIAKELLDNNTIGSKFTPIEKDLIILALILHDSVKRGIPMESYTRFDHPLLASKLVSTYAKETSLKEEEITLLKSMIETHMGEWTTDYNGNEILKKPTTKYQKFVHMCDYLSSKKFLDILFDNNDEIIY